jgi:hypothetical protein
VEALANLPDTALKLVGPDGRTWREKAQAFLAISGDAGAVTAIAAENERLRADLTASKEAQEALSARLTALEALKAPELGVQAPATPLGAPEAPKGKAGVQPAKALQNIV